MLWRGVMLQEPTRFDWYTHDEWLEAYSKVMATRRSSQHFIYAHSRLPDHVFWAPKDRLSDQEEQAAYKARLAEADEEIKANLKLLANDRDAIVIIASDHGGSLLIPQPHGNYDMRHILDHHGILLAIRWPQDYRPTLRLNCLQNVLLEVMIYLSNDKSLVRFCNPGRTIGMWPPISSPDGVVENGIVQLGRRRGKSIFRAATLDFESMKGSSGSCLWQLPVPMDLKKAILRDATLEVNASNAYVRCQGSLKRSWDQESLAEYVATQQYIGMRARIENIQKYSSVTFWGRKVAAHGQPLLVMQSANGKAQVLFQKNYREIDDEWHLYTVDLPICSGDVDFIFNGGYTDKSGSGDSCYLFRDIQLICQEE